MKWINDCYPDDGQWCWVANQAGEILGVAMLDRGVWSNGDTWQDFNNDVFCWIPLETPHHPREQTDFNTLGTHFSRWGEPGSITDKTIQLLTEMGKV